MPEACLKAFSSSLSSCTLLSALERRTTGAADYTSRPRVAVLSCSRTPRRSLGSSTSNSAVWRAKPLVSPFGLSGYDDTSDLRLHLRCSCPVSTFMPYGDLRRSEGCRSLHRHSRSRMNRDLSSCHRRPLRAAPVHPRKNVAADLTRRFHERGVDNRSRSQRSCPVRGRAGAPWSIHCVPSTLMNRSARDEGPRMRVEFSHVHVACSPKTCLQNVGIALTAVQDSRQYLLEELIVFWHSDDRQ